MNDTGRPSTKLAGVMVAVPLILNMPDVDASVKCICATVLIGMLLVSQFLLDWRKKQ